MGFGDFQLNNNGKREQLHDVKQGVRKEQLDKKFHALFDAYDANKDGTLETDELNGILKGLQSFAGADKVLDSNENLQVTSIFASEANIQDADFQGFVKSVSTASADILETKEKQTPDGGKEVTTTYNDGTTETIAFYSNGDYKWKKTEKRTLETSFELIIDGKKHKFNDETKFKKALETQEQKNLANATQNARNKQKASQSTDGISKYIQLPVSKVHTNTFSKENIDRKESYSPRFIAETLGVNVATEDGKKIVERLSQLPQETLEKLKDGKELKELISSQELEPTFDNISNVLEITEGVTLRNEEEYKATETQRQEILTQIKAANFMANVYETLASYNDQYTDSVGLFGLGSEGIGYVLNKLGLDGENHYQFADSCREWAKNSSELKVLNPQKFKEGFKNIYGDNAKNWGIDYNSEAFKKCFALAESGKAYDKDNKMTEEYKDAILKAMNIVADDPNDSTFNQVMNGFGEALIMYVSFGLGAEIEAGARLAITTMGTFSKLGVSIASKQVKNKLLQGALRFSGQAVKLVGPALNEGTKMYLYTAAEGTLANVSNRAIKQDGFDKLLDTQAQVMTNANGSFTFGAFAGVFGSTVTQKVMQSASKVSTKVTTALGEKFSKGAVDANEVFTTILEKSAPTKIAEAAAFATDVVGFTAFESALSIANTLQREGTLTPEKLADTLMEEFGHQGYSLGQIKVISHLIMMLTGSRSARMQSQKYLQENLPQLKGVTVEGVNGGKEGFKINLPDGRRIECKNASEMISALQLMVRGETALSRLFDNKNKPSVETVAPKTQETAGNKGETKVGETRTQETPSKDIAPTETTGKKPYVKQEVKHVEFPSTEPVCAPETKAEGNNEYRANNILDKVFDETTIPKTKSRLKEIGFTEEEINSIDLKDANVQRAVEVFINLLKIKPEIKENLNNAEIAELLNNKEGLENFLKEEAKFFTEENCEILTKNVIFDDGGDIKEIFRDYNNPEKIMNLLPILTQNGKHKVFGSQLQLLGYFLDTPENIAKITPEKIDLMYKINDQIENKKYGIPLNDILNLDNVNSELANDYVKEANRFSKFGIENVNEDTLEETVAKRKAVSDFLEQYPIDLTCKDYEGNLSKLSGYAVYKLSQSTNKAEVQKFVNSLSTEARKNYAGYSSYVDKGFSAEKLSNLINEYRKGNFGEIQGDIYKLLDAMLETGSKDYDSMIDLINAYKGTDVLSWYGNKNYVQVANGDYKGAVKYIEQLKELGIDLEFKDRILENSNSDYNLINEYIKKGFPIKFSESINRYNEVLIKKLLKDRDLNSEDASDILRTINKDNVILAEKLCADKEFSKYDIASILTHTNKDNIILAEKLYADKEFSKEHIADIVRATNKDNITFAEKLCADKEFPKNEIANVVRVTSKDNIAFAEKLCADKEFPKNEIANVVRVTSKDNIAFAEKLCADKEFPKEYVVSVLYATNKDNIAFAEKLCAEKEFPREQVASILKATNKDNIAFAEKLCAEKEFPREQVASILKATNKDNIAFAEKLCADKNIPKDKIPEIINATKINDPNDAGGNNGKTDSKKIDRYSRLFQNQTTAKWAGDMLRQGFDIETISKLAPTKQSFFIESVDNVASKQVVETQKALSPLETIRVETIQEFESIGLDTKQANAVYKAISKNGVVDALLKSKAIDLINKGVAKNKIGDILNSAQITGEFNSKIVDDFILLQNRGLNPLLEKNLAVLNNISGADCATKFNSKVRNQMKAMINNLPDAVKNSLKEQGVEIDSILKKLDSQVVRTSNNVPTRAKVESGFRSKAKITGFERIVIDKYEPTEQIWRNEEATKKWAEEKYTEYKNREYVSTRNTSEDPQLGEKVTQKRKEMLQEWYNFMETDENIKNNPFVKVILCDFITKELEPERSTTPPVLDKDVVKQILGDAANSSNFSFSNAYTKKMKELSAKNSSGQQVEINGRKGTWYTVPKTDSSSPDFKANAAKIRAFSDGTNWCIRTWNAEPYVQKGAMHFFVDENGLTQICIREDGAPGSVYEIQKRQQDQSAPVAYLDVIQSYMKEHELKPQDYCQGELDKAIAQKPQYDKLKSELDVLNNKKDYKGILEKMGITVNVLSDGTFELSHYTSYIDKIALNDFGINENELLANVSKIQGNASFKDSNVTALPLLQEVGGQLDFGYANISNIKNLQKINGKNIQW